MLQYAEDMEIDIPKIWQYLGELISPMIQDGSVPLGFLKKAAAPLVPNNKAGVLMAAVLHDASNREVNHFIYCLAVLDSKIDLKHAISIEIMLVQYY